MNHSHLPTPSNASTYRGLLVSCLAVLTLVGCSQVDEAEAPPEQETDMAAGTDPLRQDSATGNEPRFGIVPRPVRVGLDGPDLDACGGYGEIRGVSDEGGSVLSVRNAPNTNADEVDQIGDGTGVYVCEETSRWIGVVYGRAGTSGADCEVSSPVPEAEEYRGPCRSGWVSKRNVELLAG